MATGGTRRLCLIAARAAALLVFANAPGALGGDPFRECSEGAAEATIEACTEVLAAPEITDESRAAALMNRATGYFFSGNVQLAERDYSSAIQVDPGSGSAYFNRGQLYFSIAEYEKAVRDYNIAVLLDPRMFLPHWRLAESYCRLGLREVSLGAWVRALSSREAVIRLQTELHDQGRFKAMISGEIDRWTRDALGKWVAAGCPTRGD